MSEIKNAKITSTALGPEDHGIFTSMLYLEGKGWGIGFGGYGIDEWDDKLDRRVDKTGVGLEWIRAIMDVVGVYKWEDLPGKHVRVDLEGYGGKALGIGNLLDEDKWFYPKEWFEARREKE